MVHDEEVDSASGGGLEHFRSGVHRRAHLADTFLAPVLQSVVGVGEVGNLTPIGEGVAEPGDVSEGSRHGQ
ncbi:MAG: hypothetical protein ACKOLZ_03820, partial [Verrucomicrobiota bacterium]